MRQGSWGIYGVVLVSHYLRAVPKGHQFPGPASSENRQQEGSGSLEAVLRPRDAGDGCWEGKHNGGQCAANCKRMEWTEVESALSVDCDSYLSEPSCLGFSPIQFIFQSQLFIQKLNKYLLNAYDMSGMVFAW